VDFSWVKQLAEQTNQLETHRQDRDRRAKEDSKTVALATNPFVEKLHLVINGATEEFNKHCIYPQLRVQTSKLYKHSKTGPEPTAEPDEVSYFTFYRKGYMYGIRGVNGIVEFVQVPVGDSLSSFSIKLHEMGVTPTKSMTAEIDPDTRKIRWKMDGVPLDGPQIVSMCQKFFVDFIEQTNIEEEEHKRR
jgi:hypothetical protein